MSMFSPAACLATKNLGSRRSTACCAAPVAPGTFHLASFSKALNYHFDSVEDNPDMPCEFGEANRKRVRHMFPFLGFPLALSINENSNSGLRDSCPLSFQLQAICHFSPVGSSDQQHDRWLPFSAMNVVAKIIGIAPKFFTLRTQLKLCPDKERSSWREQHIACTGIQSSIVENETVYEIGRG
ncbi:hypothetical protein MUK42_21423 [Musa troglodytarum]|uniref:Uncharacterized protein n=1 Tax=Musa troglodytarum TaxID=320322 RepID=A0A9E7G520_9LILI|nr:hypothetical protein MUK42_21423 [Musa troglodytarum]